MSKKKTIKQWLETLPDGYRERALVNMDPEDSNTYCETLSSALLVAFFWKNAPEGYVFWGAADDWSLGGGELPPLPEEEVWSN